MAIIRLYTSSRRQTALDSDYYFVELLSLSLYILILHFDFAIGILVRPGRLYGCQPVQNFMRRKRFSSDSDGCGGGAKDMCGGCQPRYGGEGKQPGSSGVRSGGCMSYAAS